MKKREKNNENAPKKKDRFEDDGRTVSPMSAEWMPWNVGNTDPRRAAKDEKAAKGNDEVPKSEAEPHDREDARGEKLTKEELRAMIKGAFSAAVPFIIGMVVVGVALYVIARLWLMP